MCIACWVVTPVADETWASDVPISMPVPPKASIVRPLDGWGVTWYGGVVHDIDENDLEREFTPTFAPVRPSELEGPVNE